MLFRRLARGLATFGLALACAAEARAGAQALRVRAVELGSTLEDFIPQRQLLPLTTTSVLIRTTGPLPEHRELSCADGVTQLVEGLDGIPKITLIPTPSGGPFCEHGDEGPQHHLLRLSATRVLMVQFGVDQVECNGDDGLFLLDDLGGANTVVPIPSLGSMCNGSYMARLSDDTAVVTGLGSGAATALLSHLGVTNEITWLPPARPITVLAPDRLLLGFDSLDFVRLVPGGIEQTPIAAPHGFPVVLDPTRVLLTDNGEDGHRNTADDVVYLFRELGPSYERLELPTPHLYFAEIIRLSPTRALVPSTGPDGVRTTADDEVLLLDHLDGAPTVTAIGVPMLMPYTLVALAPDAAAVRGDGLVLLSDLGGSNASLHPRIGELAPAQDKGLRGPVRFGPRTAAIAVVRKGRGRRWPSRDTGIAMVTVTAGGYRVRRVDVPYLSGGKGVVPLPPAGVLVATFGSAHDLDDDRDDAVAAIGGLPGAPTLQRRKALNAGGCCDFLGHATLLGNGRAVFQNWRADWYPDNRPHHLLVVRGLEGGIRLRARRVSIQPGPGGVSSLAASADLFLPEPDLFASSDLAVRVGNATQTLPEGAFEATGTGFRYLDPDGANGFLRRVEYDRVAGRLAIEGRGKGTGAETTRADNLVLSLESLDLYAAESLDGARLRSEIVYPRP